MKKKLLQLCFALASSMSYGQTTYTGFDVNFDKTVVSDGQCYANLTTDGINGFGGGNVDKLKYHISNASATYLTFVAKTTLDPFVSPYFADIYYTKGTGPTAQCVEMKNSSTGIDLQSKPKFSITLRADGDHDTVDVFLGSSDGNWPSSTYNMGNGKSYTIQIPLTKNFQTYTFDLSTTTVSTDQAFTSWASSNFVNLWGLRLKRAGAIVDVSSVAFGDKVTGISIEEIAKMKLNLYPNPANDLIRISFNNYNNKKISAQLSNGLSEVATAHGVDNMLQFDVSGLASGLYYVKIFVDGEYVQTQKVIVK